MPRALRQADKPEHGLDPFPAFPTRQRFQKEGQRDVLRRRQHRQQVVELEDDAERLMAPTGAAALAHRGDVAAIDGNPTRLDVVQTRDQVQQRRLAGARGSHDGNEIAAGNGERQAVKDDGTILAFAKSLADVGELHIGVCPIVHVLSLLPACGQRPLG
jgi:hypothetical protein